MTLKPLTSKEAAFMLDIPEAILRSDRHRKRGMEDFVERGGIYFPTDEPAGADSAYRRVWDQEANEDAVYSATGVVSRGREDYATLTATRNTSSNGFPLVPAGESSPILLRQTDAAKQAAA